MSQLRLPTLGLSAGLLARLRPLTGANGTPHPQERKILAYNVKFDLGRVQYECHRHEFDPGHLGDRGNWGCIMNYRSERLRTRWLPLGVSTAREN
jgi:hypothetical protein